MAKDTKTTAQKKKAKAPVKKANSTVAKKTAAKKPAAKKKVAPAKKPAAKKKAAPAKKKPASAAKVATEETAQSQSAAPNESSAQEEATPQPSARETLENTFPGLDKNRDWQSFAFRLLYIIGFGFLGWLAFLSAIIMTCVQVVITILLGSPNEALQSWICSIGKYISEVFEYVSWRSDERPFPLDKPAPLEETPKS